MKRILIIATILATTLVAKSQQCFRGTTANPASAACENTVLNATTDTLLFTVSGSFSSATIHARLTKNSSGGGTIAGTMRLYGSNWATDGTWTPVSDTATLSNQSVNSKVWTLTTPSYRNYMILQSGGTTMAGKLGAKFNGVSK